MASALNNKFEKPTDAALTCVCGYGLTLDIKTADDVETAKKLLEIKYKN